MTYIKNLHFMELYVVTVKKLLLSNKPHSQIQKKSVHYKSKINIKNGHSKNALNVVPCIIKLTIFTCTL